MKTVHTEQAPKALGPYSQAIVANGFVFISGQGGIDPATGTLQEGVEAQTLQAMKNIEAILKEAGTDFSKVVKTTCQTSMTSLNLMRFMLITLPANRHVAA